MQRTCRDHGPIVMMRKSEDSVVMISLEDCEALEETASVVSAWWSWFAPPRSSPLGEQQASPMLELPRPVRRIETRGRVQSLRVLHFRSMPQLTLNVSLDEIKSLVLQLPAADLLALSEAIADRAETVAMMRVAESAFQLWNENGEDIYDVWAQAQTR
jgi:hypothetical protein